jgi:hypothetical protein
LAAAMFPYCAFFPVSRLVLAFNTAATGTCILMEAAQRCWDLDAFSSVCYIIQSSKSTSGKFIYKQS